MKVAVLYHDFPYFFCMAAIRSSVFEIFAGDVVSDVTSGRRRIATMKKKYLTLSSLIVRLASSTDYTDYIARLRPQPKRTTVNRIQHRRCSQIPAQGSALATLGSSA